MYSATLYFTDGVAQESTNYAPPTKSGPQLKKCTDHKRYSPQAENGFYIFYGCGEGGNENSMTHGNHIRFKISVSINVYFWNMATLI